MGRIAALSCMVFLMLHSAGASAAADSASLGIELNRLEERSGGCRVHLVLENTDARSYSAYRLDLVIFGKDGVIARRLALDAAPLRAHKTTVKEFEIVDLACARVGRVLLNDISACSSDAGEVKDCVLRAKVSSRATVEFVK